MASLPGSAASPGTAHSWFSRCLGWTALLDEIRQAPEEVDAILAALFGSQSFPPPRIQAMRTIHPLSYSATRRHPRARIPLTVPEPQEDSR